MIDRRRSNHLIRSLSRLQTSGLLEINCYSFFILFKELSKNTVFSFEQKLCILIFLFYTILLKYRYFLVKQTCLIIKLFLTKTKVKLNKGEVFIQDSFIQTSRNAQNFFKLTFGSKFTLMPFFMLFNLYWTYIPIPGNFWILKVLIGKREEEKKSRCHAYDSQFRCKKSQNHEQKRIKLLLHHRERIFALLSD